MPQEPAANVQLVLEGDLTMRTVETVRATLRGAFEAASDGQPADIPPAAITIDCSGASEIDLTFIQLLIAAHASAEAGGRRISLAPCAPDGVLPDTLRRGGFEIVPADDGSFWFTGVAA